MSLRAAQDLGNRLDREPGVHSRVERGRAFTLLEVLVAIAILGLGLTIILSSQTGLFSSSQHTSKLSIATGLVRCKMSELELKLLQEGMPPEDVTEEGNCCEDQDYEGFTCNWRIEQIVLPLTQQANQGDAGAPSPSGQAGTSGLAGPLGVGAPSAGTSSALPPSMSSSQLGGLGPLGALASIGKTQGGVLGGNADLDSVSQLMGQAQLGGANAMAPLVMNIVYPEIKAMFEASIRKVTATVSWQEGSKKQDLNVVQFVTNPTQGGFDPNAADNLDTSSTSSTGSKP